VKVLGHRLREERLRKGLELHDVSRATRIRLVFLEAIEEGRIDELPSGFVRKGFVETYAKFLKLDPHEVIKDEGETRDIPPLPFMKHRRKGVLVLAVALIFTTALAGGIYSLHRKVEEMKGKTQPSPQGEVQALGIRSLSPSGVKDEGKKPKEEAPQEHILEIRASHLTWIEIRKGKEPPYDITLYPGERYRISDPLGFSLKIGNAGGVRVIFDGKDLGKLGEIGQVVKLILPKRPPRPSPRGSSP